MNGISEGYAALCISILKCVDPDRAFGMLDDPRGRRRWIDEDIAEIESYRQEGYTWKSIGGIFGCDYSSIFKIAKYHRDKKTKEGMMDKLKTAAAGVAVEAIITTVAWLWVLAEKLAEAAGW